MNVVTEGKTWIQMVSATARVSDCGRYRYELTRIWDREKGVVNWIMLNPSTADATADDPTIRRCIGFADGWGFGGIVVTNLFALRATDPRMLKASRDPVGRENSKFIYSNAMDAKDGGLIVGAWGQHGLYRGRAGEVRQTFLDHKIPMMCLGLSKDGQPKHPLYIAGNTKPITFLAGRQY